MNVFLTLVFCLQHGCGAVTLPKSYDSVDHCWDRSDEAISEFVEGTPFPYALKNKTCGIANDRGSTEMPAPLHLRDLGFAKPGQDI